MLQRNYRLRQRGHIRQVFAEGKSFPGKHVVIYVHKGPTKFAFIASKKVGNAVLRNRAKRLMREAVRLNLSRFKEDVQLICIARASIKGVRLAQLERSVLDTLKRAKILIDDDTKPGVLKDAL